MIETVYRMQRQKRFIIQGMIMFVVFLGLYTLLDSFNGGYQVMAMNYGMVLVIGNIVLNIVMAFISAMMMNFSSALVKLSRKEGKGTAFTGIAVLFGMLTYGCTPCVIALFATIGITFSVAVLPLAGLPYKLIAFILLIIGLIWLLYEIKKSKCDIELK